MENIIITKTKTIEYLQFNKLLEFKDDLIHAYTLKTYEVGFNRNKNENGIVDKSYGKITNEFNIKKECIVQPVQKHTDNIYEFIKDKNISYNDITKLGMDKIEVPNQIKNLHLCSDGNKVYFDELNNTDGIITNEANVATLLSFADCMSLFIYDPKNKIIANIHSGWKGTVKQIGIKAVNKMIKNYNCKAENIICCFGPSIRRDHFLVNDDVVEIFKNEFSDICNKNDIIQDTDFSNDKGKQYTIDTVLLNRILLKNVGLLEKNIIDSGMCTVCYGDMFHSRRLEGEEYQVNRWTDDA